ncbi:DUF397 domain-containing protein [Streptomyces sp. NPDC056821]|uniref:DUF397 domain-containing protein n=1 Tax=unclassified Streptomyces TaxID=2593676 RepID=UPI003676F596
MHRKPWPWRKAKASDTAGNQCVEVQWTGRTVLVRDSARPHYPHLAFHPTVWQGFLNTLHHTDGAPRS